MSFFRPRIMRIWRIRMFPWAIFDGLDKKHKKNSSTNCTNEIENVILQRKFLYIYTKISPCHRVAQATERMKSSSGCGCATSRHVADGEFSTIPKKEFCAFCDTLFSHKTCKTFFFLHPISADNRPLGWKCATAHFLGLSSMAPQNN